MRQEDPGDCAYIIESGQVEILIEKDNGLVQSLGTRSAGSLIGEMALIDQKPRTATIKALEDCNLLEISAQDFNRRLTQSDPVVRLMMEVIITRYRDMLKKAHIVTPSGKFNKSEALEKSFLEKSHAVDSIRMEKELREAFFNGELFLNYQPIFDIETNKTLGFEALIRWKHPEKGFISPQEFIPLAEESRLILEISRWVLQSACKTLNEIRSTFPNEDFFMSVNFSSLDLADSSFDGHFMRIVKEENLEPSQIHLEITESLLIDEPDKARTTLEKCQRNGISISIDDFGTGYSSLSYLHYFPINIIKIDRSFIGTMMEDTTVAEIVRSIVNLAHNMNAKIIAEGIETKEQQNILSELKCQAGQGYYYSKPLNKEDLLSFLADKIQNR